MQLRTITTPRSLTHNRNSSTPGKNIFIAGAIIHEQDGYTINSANTLSSITSSSITVDYSPLIATLNRTDLSRNPGVERCICLGSPRSLKTFFDNGAEYLGDINSSTPDPNEFERGEVVLLEDRLLLFRDEDFKTNAIWRVLPANGTKLSEEELRILKTAYGLRKKAVKLEPHAYPLTTNTIKGDGSDRAKTLRDKLPDPETSEVETFQIPNTNMVLHLRSKSGNRVWAALPANGISLSDDERGILERHLETTLNDLPQVTDNDVICSGFSVESFFSGDYDVTNTKIKAKGVPEPSEYMGKTFIPKDADFTMEKKCTKCGTVWTVPRSKHKEAAIYFGLNLRNSTLEIPENAIYLWGEKAQEFWVEAGTTIAGYKNFNAAIKERFGSPRDSKEVFIPIKDEETQNVYYIFRGENGAKRYWWVEARHYEAIGKLLGYTCKKEIVLEVGAPPEAESEAVVTNMDTPDPLLNEEPLLILIVETERERLGVTTKEFDHREDGTNDRGRPWRAGKLTRLRVALEKPPIFAYR
jgi:hypothetical protein